MEKTRRKNLGGMAVLFLLIMTVFWSVFALETVCAGTVTDLLRQARDGGKASESGPNGQWNNRLPGSAGYSSWNQPRTKAFEVPEEYSMEILSTKDDTGESPATSLKVSGNVKSKVKAVYNALRDQTLCLEPENNVIFKLKQDKENKGVSLTYRNLYVYSPDDPGALKSGKIGYIPVDLKVRVDSFTLKKHKSTSKSTSYTEDPYIAFSKSVHGLPAVTMYNVGAAGVTYSYRYGRGSSQEGKKLNLKTNMTYTDVDVQQGIGIKGSGQKLFVAGDTELRYGEGNGYRYFLGIDQEINGGSMDGYYAAFAHTIEGNSEHILYHANAYNRITKKELPSPDGNWTYFGTAAYSMVAKPAPGPIKGVEDSDSVTASMQGGKVVWGTGEEAMKRDGNGIGSPESGWTYSVEQVVPGGMNPKWAYGGFAFSDKVNQLLDIQSVNVTLGRADGSGSRKDVTGWFSISKEKNHVKAEMKESVQKDADSISQIYRKDDTNFRMTIRVKLNRNLTMQDLRGAGVLTADTRGEEGAVCIANSAEVTVMGRSTSYKKDLPDTIKTNAVTTYIRIPSIDDPEKKVSDRDEKNTDSNVIRFFDDEPFVYDVCQNVKKDQIHFDDFTLLDGMDPCIHEESDQDQIRVYGTKNYGEDKGMTVDCTDSFSITVDEDSVEEARGLKYNTVKAEAKKEALDSEDFYGYRYDLRWKNDLKSETKYREQGIGLEHWKTCSAASGEKFGHLNADETSLTVPNKAVRIIDSGKHVYPPYIAGGGEVDIVKTYRKETNPVNTTIYLPKISVSKSADRYEYQVYNGRKDSSADDTIHYTVKIRNSAEKPDGGNAANYAVLRDTDFPEGLVIDPGSFRVSGFDEKNRRYQNAAEYGGLKKTEDQYGKEQDFAEGLNLDFEEEASEKKLAKARYTIRTVREKNGRGGFEFRTRYLSSGEEVIIEFDGKAGKKLNGTHVTNKAVFSADGTPDTDDKEIVYINSPKMQVTKTSSEDFVDENGEPVKEKKGAKKKYHTGDTINFKVVVRNINPGTFARNVTFSDELYTGEGKASGLTINSNSITVRDMEGNLYERGANGAGSEGGKGDYLLRTLKDSSGRESTGFSITFTKPNIGYYKETAIPPVSWSNGPEWQQGNTNEEAEEKAKVNSHYDYIKNYKNLQLMNGYIVTYSVTVTDGELAGKNISNIAAAVPGENSNGEKVKDDPDIPSGKGEGEKDVPLDGHDPRLKITKNSDQREYKVGDTGHYEVTVTNPVEKTQARNVIIRDQFDFTGMEVDKDSIKVSHNGTDITGTCGIDTLQTGYSADGNSNSKAKNGWQITPTGKYSDLRHGDKITINYDVHFLEASLFGKNIRNVARASSDNCREEAKEEPESVKVEEDGLTAVKSSDPMPGTRINQGKVIRYTVTVNNPGKKDISNVIVRDRIPEFGEYAGALENGSGISGENEGDDGEGNGVSGKPAGDPDMEKGRLIHISGHPYFAALIKKIPAGGSGEISFRVRVSDKVPDQEIIHNTAEVHRVHSNELEHGADASVPEELFKAASFAFTNTVDHPLRYWVEADNTVTITKPDDPEEKEDKPEEQEDPEDPETEEEPAIPEVSEEPESLVEEDPELTLKKAVKERSFKKGDILHYSLILRAKKGEVKRVKISDVFNVGGMAYAEDSIRIILEGKDITSICTVSLRGRGMQIDTGKNLKKGEKLKITYRVRAQRLPDKDAVNMADGSGENSGRVTDKAVTSPERPGRSQRNARTSGGSKKDMGGDPPVRTFSNIFQTGDKLPLGRILIISAALFGAIGFCIFRRKKL